MIEKQPRPEWGPVPREGTRNVDGRVLLYKDNLVIANLRFSPNATIDRHSAPFDIDVLCIEGKGKTSIDDDVFDISAGDTIRWPRDKDHCLWTDDATMETIMVERHG